MTGENLPTEKKMETEADGEILVQDPQVGDGTRLLRVAQIVGLVHHKVTISLNSLKKVSRKQKIGGN